jgi:thioredoxin 1
LSIIKGGFMADTPTKQTGAPHWSHDDLKQALTTASDTPIFIDFYADWCGPCKLAAPIVDKLAGEYEGRIRVVKLNVDDNNEAAQEHGVMSIPTTLVFVNKDGEMTEVDRKIGFPGEPGFRQMLEKVAPAAAPAKAA